MNTPEEIGKESILKAAEKTARIFVVKGRGQRDP